MNPAAVGHGRRPQEQPVYAPRGAYVVQGNPRGVPVVPVNYPRANPRAVPVVHVGHAPANPRAVPAVQVNHAPNLRGRHVEHAPVGGGRPGLWATIFGRRQPNVVVVDNGPRVVRTVRARDIFLSALIITAVAIAAIAVVAVAAII